MFVKENPDSKKKSIFWNVASLNSIAHDVINSLYYEHWTDKWKYLYVSLKDFRRYQNLIDFFKDLRDVNPKEVLKDEINFISDLREIRKGNQASKSKSLKV